MGPCFLVSLSIVELPLLDSVATCKIIWCRLKHINQAVCTCGSQICWKSHNMYIHVTSFSERIIIIICQLAFQINLHVNDLFTDLSDGKVLIKLLETISGEKIGTPGKIIYFDNHHEQ